MNSALDQADLIDIYRALYPKSTESTFFSAPHYTYSKIDHIIECKSLLSKYKRMEIIINSLLEHSAIKLELRIIAALFTIANTWNQPKCPYTLGKCGTYTPWNIMQPSEMRSSCCL